MASESDKNKYYKWSSGDDKVEPAPTELASATSQTKLTEPVNSGKKYGWCSAVYIMLGLIIVGGALSLICIGVIRVKPYMDALAYTEASCEVVSANYTGDFLRCGCGKHCSSRYPCLQVIVNVTSTNSSSGYQALLHENEYAPNECTFKPSCVRNEQTNSDRVDSYKVEYGQIGQKHECLVNPDDVHVIRIISGKDWALHGMLWPSLFMVIAAIVLVIVVVKVGCGRNVWRSGGGYSGYYGGWGGGY